MHVLAHVALMGGLQVVLHLVGPRKLLAAHRTGKHLSLGALVVQKGMALETVLVLECFLNILFGAFRALVDTVADDGVFKEIQAAHTHLRQLLRGIFIRAARFSADPSTDLRPW